MENFRYLEGVASLELVDDLCIGCGMCETVCPHTVFRVIGKKAELIDHNGCMECGACANNCPTGALKVNPGVGCASYIIMKWWMNLRGKEGEIKCC